MLQFKLGGTGFYTENPIGAQFLETK